MLKSLSFSKLKKKFKHEYLAKYIISKGYPIDEAKITNLRVDCDSPVGDVDSLNVLIKGWKFTDQDHCYLEEISDPGSSQYQTNECCPLCNVKMEAITEVRGNSGSLGLQSGRCPSCFFIKHTRNLSQEWYAAHFRDKWLACDDDRQENIYAKDQPFDDVKNLLKPNAEVADIGFGMGDRLKKFKDHGLSIHGCDPSDHRSEIASRFLGSKMVPMGGEEFFASNEKKFDLVYFYTTLHFTENPFFLIKEAAKSLKNEGYIYIVDSKYTYHNLFHAAHLGVGRSYMSLKSISILAAQLGLKIVRVEYEPFTVLLSNKATAPDCKLFADADTERFMFSELYPDKQSHCWFQVKYQPYNREIKFHVVNNNGLTKLKNKEVSYPIKFVSTDYEKPPVLLK